MKVLVQIIVFLIAGFNSVLAQPTNNFSDMLLTSTMKVFQSADFEMAYYMVPFVHERFEKELKDTNSFHQPYDSLSKYIGIKYSSDSLLKTYCWSERSGGCCHTSTRLVQYRTQSGNIQYVDLDEDTVDGGDLFITKLHKIEIDSQTMYLFLNWMKDFPENGSSCRISPDDSYNCETSDSSSGWSFSKSWYRFSQYRV